MVRTLDLHSKNVGSIPTKIKLKQYSVIVNI